MSRTNRPLQILVHSDLWDAPAIIALREKQNTVIPLMDITLQHYDLVIGPNCWRIVPGMENVIDMAVKAARRAKYGKKENDPVVDPTSAAHGDV